jgi:glycosyltransferase involved in cell wall biosynthesis
LRVLHAIHDFLPRHRAGSEIYAAQLCRELAARHHVTVVCADYDPARAHGEVTWRLHDDLPVVEIANNWVCGSFEDTYRSPVMSARLEQVLDAVQPHLVHVHNLLNLSFELPAAARARGIPVVATLHDYTLVCAAGGQRIHRADAHVCRTIDPARCARCFVESPFHSQAAVGPVASAMAASGLLHRAVSTARRWSPALVHAAARTMGNARRLPVTETDITARLAHARKVFDQVDLFVAPSPSLAEAFVALGLDPSKVRVSDYGFPAMSRPARVPPGDRLRIGFVGTLVWHKGVHVLLDAIRRLPEHAYELHVHGDLTVSPEYVEDLRLRARGLPVHFHGGFDRTRTAAVYGSLDLLVVPSLWLENSPLVIHEAFQAGIPVVGSRIGGTADLIADRRCGRLYDPGSAAELAAILQSVIDDRSQLAAWAGALPAVKTIAEDAREWERVYAAIASPVSVAAVTV